MTSELHSSHFALIRIPLLVTLLGSLGFSIGFLANRNIYDDEVGSFWAIHRSMSQIVRAANSLDVHPPGMYVALRISSVIFPSARWAATTPLLILYTALVIFAYFGSKAFRNDRGAVFFFLTLVFFHPQLLMWINSIRWYPYWTGLALLTITYGLRLDAEDQERTSVAAISLQRAVLLGVLWAAMFYLNYLTGLFIIAFSGAYLVRFGIRRRSLRDLFVSGFVALPLVLPQIVPFWTVHWRNKGLQQGNFLGAAAHLFYGLFISEAILPWKPIALIFGASVSLPLAVLSLGHWIRRVPGRDLWSWYREDADNRWLSLVTVFVALSALGILTGLSTKARSFILLSPVLGYILALGFQSVGRRGFRVFFLLILVLWVGFGCSDLLLKRGTAKGGINDHLEDVARFLQLQAEGRCSVIFLHDPALPYVLNNSREGRKWSVVSVFPDYFHHIPSGFIGDSCSPQMIFVIKSFMGSLLDEKRGVEAAEASALNGLDSCRVMRFSRDPDAPLKRRVTGAEDLPNFRFEVWYGPPRSGVDWQGIAKAYGSLSIQKW